MQVLIVVAEPIAQQALEKLFVGRQLPTKVVNGPAEARVHVEREVFHFAVIDLAGDPEEALELCRQIRRQPHGAETYILVLPVAETQEALRGALEAGADDYLVKPIEPALLPLRLAIGHRHRTTRLKTLKQIEASEKRYRTLVETMHEGLFQIDESGIIRFANSRMSKITGYANDEIVGQSADRLLIAPEVRERLPGQTLLGAGTGSEEYSIPLRTKSGEPVWVNLTGAPMPADEGRGGSLGVVQDITEQRKAEEGLRFREQYFRALLENASDLITLLDLDGRILYQSLSSQRLVGLPADDLVGRDFHELLHEADRERFAGAIRTSLEQAGAGDPVELRLRHTDGHWCELESLVNNMLDNPVVGGVVVTSRDVTERRGVEVALKRERAFFQQLFRSSPAGIVILGNDDRVVDANDAFVDLFGYEVDEIAGRPLNELIVPEKLHAEASELSRSVIRQQTVDRETVRRRKDGTAVDVAILGSPIELATQRIGAFGIYTDITERKNAERKLFHDAFHDALTGLPNRTLLSERLERSLRRSKRRTDYQFALLFIDLDRFKVINDSLGHAAGDELLIEISRRLEGCLRPGDTVARLGGDEFTIILEDVQEVADATRVSERILEALGKPFVVTGQEVVSSGSIGIAFSSTGYDRADDIVRDADLAMYRAKSAGKARYEIFDTEMHRGAVERLKLETELRHAIERKQLRVHYLPVVSLTSGRMVGFEALVRWQHPERGLVRSGELVPVCEETGLIVPLGRWMLAQACRQLVAWQKRFPEHDCLLVSLNLSVQEISAPDFVSRIDQILKKTGAPASALGFEVTESLMSGEAAGEVAETLWQLQKRGFRLYIDDFGTGYSSLSALHRYPIDSLKIDSSFVGDLEPGGESLEIVRAVAALGESLGLTVIAEGVEDREHLEQLRKLGVGYAQGYYFSQPLPGAEVEKLIEDNPTW